MKLRTIGWVLALSLVAASGFAVANPSRVGAIVDSVVTTSQNTDEHQVTICHAVEGNGNTGNGYNIITVDKDSISSNPNGHDTHEGDLIPPFDAGFTVGPPPKQWNAYPGKGDYSLIATNCAEPDTTTTGTTTTTTTGTETTTTETTTTTTETQPPRCPPGEVPTDGKDGEPGNEECEPPGGTTTTETTTTTSPPPTTTDPPTETTAPPETTTPPQTTPEPPAVKPPAAKPPAAKPPKTKSPKAKPPKMPPPCPVAKPTTGKCAVQGSG